MNLLFRIFVTATLLFGKLETVLASPIEASQVARAENSEKIPHQVAETYYEIVPYEATESYTDTEPYTDREYVCQNNDFTQRECDWENVQKSRLVNRTRTVIRHRQEPRIRTFVR